MQDIPQDGAMGAPEHAQSKGLVKRQTQLNKDLWPQGWTVEGGSGWELSNEINCTTGYGESGIYP